MPPLHPFDRSNENLEPAIDLESSGIIDVEQVRLCAAQSDDANDPRGIEIVEPHAAPRCPTRDREILRSPFPNL